MSYGKGKCVWSWSLTGSKMHLAESDAFGVTNPLDEGLALCNSGVTRRELQ